MENTPSIEQEPKKDLRAEAIESMVKKLAEYTPPIPERKDHETDVEYLSKILEGNSKQRIRLSNVSEEWKQQNHDRAYAACQEAIEDAVKNNKPIEIMVGPVGTIKWPKLHEAPENNEPDIVELCAILHVIRIAEAVKKTYEPGCNITIGFEDIMGPHVIPGDKEEIKKSQEHYFTKLDEITSLASSLAAFPREKINLVKESATSDLPFPVLEQNFANETERLSKLMYSYLTESENLETISQETVSTLPSFQALLQEGWSGVISRETRADRKKKIGRYQPGIDDDTLTKDMADFFASSLARKHIALGRHNKTVTYSLIPPSPGDPVAGKFFLRSIPNIDNNTPPWISEAIVEEAPLSLNVPLFDFKVFSLCIDTSRAIQDPRTPHLGYERTIDSQEIKVGNYLFTLPVITRKVGFDANEFVKSTTNERWNWGELTPPENLSLTTNNGSTVTYNQEENRWHIIPPQSQSEKPVLINPNSSLYTSPVDISERVSHLDQNSYPSSLLDACAYLIANKEKLLGGQIGNIDRNVVENKNSTTPPLIINQPIPEIPLDGLTVSHKAINVDIRFTPTEKGMEFSYDEKSPGSVLLPLIKVDGEVRLVCKKSKRSSLPNGIEVPRSFVPANSSSRTVAATVLTLKTGVVSTRPIEPTKIGTFNYDPPYTSTSCSEFYTAELPPEMAKNLVNSDVEVLTFREAIDRCDDAITLAGIMAYLTI